MKHLFAALALATVSSAQTWNQTESRIDSLLIASSNGSAPPFGYSAFSSAESNATRILEFNRGTQNWTWTLAISDVELPNTPNVTNFTSGWNAPPDARVAYTTYQFEWPGEMNMNGVARSEARNVSAVRSNSCFYNIWTEFPDDVSSAWDSSSSSCRSAIGNECEEHIKSSLETSADCRSRDISQLTLSDKCPGIFGGGVVYFGFTFGDASTPANETAFESGDVVSYTVSDLAASGNITAFEHAENRLHMVIMANAQGTQVMCNRIAETSSSSRYDVSLVLIGVATMIAVGLQ